MTSHQDIPVTVDSPEILRAHLAQARGAYYVYMLADPLLGAEGPFYVGIGQGLRLFQHEDEARDLSRTGRKVEMIRDIWTSGGHVVRYIDSWHDAAPWHREAELIERWGLLKDGTGRLTNEQRYDRSALIDGAELRKYAVIGNKLPPSYRCKDLRLYPGPRRPRSPHTVYGKIYAAVEKSPGVTGAQLVELLMAVDFSDRPSAYVQSGQVSRPWLAGYIDGAFYAKNQHLSAVPPT